MLWHTYEKRNKCYFIIQVICIYKAVFYTINDRHFYSLYYTHKVWYEDSPRAFWLCIVICLLKCDMILFNIKQPRRYVFFAFFIGKRHYFYSLQSLDAFGEKRQNNKQYITRHKPFPSLFFFSFSPSWLPVPIAREAK